MNKSWLQENIGQLLAVIIVVFSLCTFLLILTHVISATENVAFLIIGSLSSLVTTIVNYFYGSSAGSKSKQASLDKINDNTTTVTNSIKTETKDGTVQE